MLVTWQTLIGVVPDISGRPVYGSHTTVNGNPFGVPQSIGHVGTRLVGVTHCVPTRLLEHRAIGGVHARRAGIVWRVRIVWCQGVSLGDVAQIVCPDAFRHDALACRIPRASAAGRTQLCGGTRLSLRCVARSNPDAASARDGAHTCWRCCRVVVYPDRPPEQQESEQRNDAGFRNRATIYQVNQTLPKDRSERLKPSGLDIVFGFWDCRSSRKRRCRERGRLVLPKL